MPATENISITMQPGLFYDSSNFKVIKVLYAYFTYIVYYQPDAHEAHNQMIAISVCYRGGVLLVI